MSSEKEHKPVLDLEVLYIKVRIDLIKACIIKSRSVVLANAARQSIRNAQFYTNRLPFIVPKEDFLSTIIKELEEQITKLKLQISISIKNLALSCKIQDIYIEDLFWFSAHDLKRGYIFLYKNKYTYMTDPHYVLFLVKVKDSFDGTIYYPGDIRLFRQVNHVLANVIGLSKKELGIGFNYASKSELMTELSNLTSSIKNQNHE